MLCAQDVKSCLWISVNNVKQHHDDKNVISAAQNLIARLNDKDCAVDTSRFQAWFVKRAAIAQAVEGFDTSKEKTWRHSKTWKPCVFGAEKLKDEIDSTLKAVNNTYILRTRIRMPLHVRMHSQLVAPFPCSQGSHSYGRCAEQDATAKVLRRR